MGTDLGRIAALMPLYRPYTNIQPFTVRDGATYQLQIEQLIVWWRDTVVPHIDKETGELTVSWETLTQQLIEDWETRQAELSSQVDAAVDSIGDRVTQAESAKAAAEAARDQAQLYASQAEGAQDSAIATVIGNNGSESRTTLDGLFVAKSVYQAFADSLSTELDSITDALAQKATIEGLTALSDSLDSQLATVNTAVQALGVNKADLSYVDIELAGRSPMSLAGAYSSRPLATAVEVGTLFYPDDIPEVYRSTGLTWEVVGSGGNELAYAERTSNFSSGVTTRTDIPGLAITFVAGERPVEIEMFADIGSGTQSTSSGSIPRVFAVMGGTDILYMGKYIPPVASAQQTYSTHTAKRRLTGLTPGETYTVKLQVGVQAGTNFPIVNGYPTTPAYVRAQTV